PTFVGKSLVLQHQQVYKALGSRMGREIHALALKTFTPEQWAAKEKK
ncbi:MAG TPA: BolA/IbaG family iron-sulfur metabolism protein, partial [Myxococcota bacterium]|nr:BolA/IbaG family iron-sulfur metabolism protein [Myxococcota bacterium]